MSLSFSVLLIYWTSDPVAFCLQSQGVVLFAEVVGRYSVTTKNRSKFAGLVGAMGARLSSSLSDEEISGVSEETGCKLLHFR